MNGPLSLRLARLQFGTKQRLKLYREFAALLRSGMSKFEAIRLLWIVASDNGRKQGDVRVSILQHVMRMMQNGVPFSRAMYEFVPADDRMILEAAENSDDFPAQLDSWVEITKKKKKLLGTIAGGLTYPTMLAGMVLVMLIYFGRVVVPQVAQLLPQEKWTGAAALLSTLGQIAEGPAFWVIGSLVVLIALILASLPILTGPARVILDLLPIYSLYRLYTGLGFMIGISALMRGGTPASRAVRELVPLSTPYVRERLVRLHENMLNGQDFGTALHRTGMRWPDREMTLSIMVFAQTQDLSTQMSRLAVDWLDMSQERIADSMALFRSVAMVLVFACIMGIVAGMYALQEQIAAAVQMIQ